MSDRPNVLLITADHWMGDLLGCAGHPTVLTPTMDSLAGNGVRFPNADSEAPVCVPGRRCLMLGQDPRAHGMNDNPGYVPYPEGATTIAQAFGNAGYQTQCVGKLHVKPQRSRIGFDEVLLDEEGRARPDDYEIFLGDHGHPGKRFAGGMGNNEYAWRPWHLNEELHVTNWATQQMCRQIIRRDPAKPAFWYLSYSHPHPPLAPLGDYLDIYRDAPIPDPVLGDWCGQGAYDERTLRRIADIRRAFYALVTHIDHQIRCVIGTLREQGLLNDTIICVTSDHGDMLGDHGLWAKRRFYRNSCHVPMVLSGVVDDAHNTSGRVDERLVGLQDVMPTLLDLAGIPVPDSCTGRSMVSGEPRGIAFGECGSGAKAQRMARSERYKLVWTVGGNQQQLFDCLADREERYDRIADPDLASVREELQAALIARLSAEDRESFTSEGRLVGCEAAPAASPYNRGCSAQRGLHWPR